MSTKRVIIIDAFNAYLRNYIVNPTLSSHGFPVGGLKGFLSSMQKMCREMKPNKIVVIWDGPGGSQRRREVNKDYKQGRKPLRVNRSIKMLTEREEEENKLWQHSRLIEYLELMPVSQIMIEGVEADDLIAHACHILHGWEKVVISSDKDFIQLCNRDTVLYRPIQKEYLNEKSIIEKYGISPCNFAMARAIVGDPSDNLAGVPRVGLKTIAKRFPIFKEHNRGVCFDALYQACKDTESKAKLFENILKHKETIEANYKLMQLYAPSISVESKRVTKSLLFDKKDQFNKTGVYKMMNEDGFIEHNWDSLFATFNSIVESSS